MHPCKSIKYDNACLALHETQHQFSDITDLININGKCMQPKTHFILLNDQESFKAHVNMSVAPRSTNVFTSNSEKYPQTKPGLYLLSCLHAHALYHKCK